MFYFKNFQSKRFSSLFKIISKINIKLLVTLICFVFLGTSIYGNFEALTNQIITIKEILWLLAGILFTFLSIIINAFSWKLLINSIGYNSNKLNIMMIFINTNIYKYLPGGIWHFVSRYNTLRLKLSTEKSVESILLEPLLMLVAGLFFVPFGSFNIYLIIICWSSVFIFLTGFREFIIKKLKSMKATIFYTNDDVNDENLVKNHPDFTTKIYYPYNSLFVEIVFVLFRFFGFLCCMNAFSIGSLIPQSKLISCFSFAWITGLVIPAAPGGIGIFESVILVSLGSQFPEAALLASLLCYRLVSTLSDIFAAFLYPVRRLLKV